MNLINVLAEMFIAIQNSFWADYLKINCNFHCSQDDIYGIPTRRVGASV